MVAMLLAALALAAANPAGSCARARPDRCSDTNRLVRAKDWAPAVRAFLGATGARRVDYLYAGGTVLGAVNEVLGGPPDDPARVGGLYRFSACRAHSCPEKGAALLTADGRIVALAVLHSDCAKQPTPDSCFRHDRLAIFVHDPRRAGAIVADLTAWARAAEAADHTAYHQPASTLDSVEVLRAG